MSDYQHYVTVEKEKATFTFNFLFTSELELQGDCLLLLSLEFLLDFTEKNKGQNPPNSRKDPDAQSIIDGFLWILAQERRDLKLPRSYARRGPEAKMLILPSTTFFLIYLFIFNPFIYIYIYIYIFFFSFFGCLEVPRLGVKPELQLPAYTMAMATPDPSPAAAQGNAKSLTH